MSTSSQPGAGLPRPFAEPVDAVDPFIGSATNNGSLGQGNTFPGAVLPHGMLSFSPVTESRPHSADFAFNDETLRGFSLTHLSGAGCDGYGDIPILPTTGPVTGDLNNRSTALVIAKEAASPGSYSVRTGEGVDARLTATTRTGLAEFSFPAGAQGNLLFKAAGSQRPNPRASVEITGPREICGWADSNGFCGTNGVYRVYFAARFDTPMSAWGTWQQGLVGDDALPGAAGELAWKGPFQLGGGQIPSSSITATEGPAGQSAVRWTMENARNSSWIRADGAGLTVGQQYQATATISGSGQAYIQFNNGTATVSSAKVALSETPQTLVVSSQVPEGARAVSYVTLRTAADGPIDITAWDVGIRQVQMEVSPGSKAASGVSLGAYASFSGKGDFTVRTRVGISYVSVDGARANLEAEQRRSPSYRTLSARARKAWSDELSSIEIHGASAEQRTTFYTALYHTFLHPSICSDADGRYQGYDRQVHTLVRGQQAQYTNVSGWDVHRSQIPLLALLRPDRTSDVITSLLAMAEQGGWLPKWAFADIYADVMNGDPCLPIIADAYAKGARSFDTKAALAAVVRNAEHVPDPAELGQGWYTARPHLAEYLANGYAPKVDKTSISPVNNGASVTLEYAVADYAGARFAAATGDTAVHDRLIARAANWRKLLNPQTRYLQPRDADGNFPQGDPLTVGMDPAHGQDGFQEGNAAQYNWLVPQDIPGLVESIGGAAATVDRLTAFFSQLNAGGAAPYMWQGNEVCFLAPWIANSAGAPWYTQEIVRKIVNQLYLPSVDGLPGNDDLGATSSWYVWAVLGLYPQTPGTPLLAVGSPLYERAVVHLGNGGRLDITAQGAGADRPYVTSLRVNGRSVERAWLTLAPTEYARPEQVIGRPGAVSRLDFRLSDRPDRSWGAAPADRAPSGMAL